MKAQKRLLLLSILLAAGLAAGLAIVLHYAHHPYVSKLRQLFSKTIQLSEKMIYPPPPINYQAYQDILQHISFENQEKIRDFLYKYPGSPLSTQLRNQWLLFLANKEAWDPFLEDYRPTNHENVECYYLKALYRTNQIPLALSGAKKLWIAGYSPSKACDFIFSRWQESSDFKEEYLWDRIALALKKKDIHQAKLLAQNLPKDKKAWVSMWIMLRNNPEKLTKTHLPDTPETRKIIIDGLKQWLTKQPEEAVKYWEKLQSQHHFEEALAQEFYGHASLYLALHGNPSAESWFNRLKPDYITDQHRAWQTRFALMHENWDKVLLLIQSMSQAEQKSYIWQYWKARALESTNRKTQAQAIYEKLAEERHYYGFLSSYRLNISLAIRQYDYPFNSESLSSQAVQIAQIKSLYDNNQLPQALILTQDLLNQLNNPQKYALARRFAEWQWYAEAMLITNRTPYKKDLRLRFPMPFQSILMPLAAAANISPAFIYALIRQESSFRNDVISPAGGLGIMQLTLSTAQQFEPIQNKKALYDINTNLRIGTAYLKRLNRQFEGHPLLIAAAYNAGPQTARYWSNKNLSKQADIWIETLPWEETRNYLKNVLSYYAVYQYLLGQEPNIAPFMKDLPRGSGNN